MSNSPFQFSLRTLLLVVTIIAVVLSMITWLHELGIAIALLSTGVVLVFVGTWCKRWHYISGGCILICGLVISSPWLSTAVCWAGHKKISVTVCVHDHFGTPIPNATVQLTDRDGTSTASTTDVSGLTYVVGNFQICGTDTLLSKTGIVELLGEKLSVQAIGFKSFDRELDETVDRGCWDLNAPTPPEVLIQLERDNQVPAGQK